MAIGCSLTLLDPTYQKRNKPMKEQFKLVKWKDGEDPIRLYYIEKLEDESSDVLVVYLHGAVSQPIFPYYNGRGVANRCKADFILFSDPMRDIDNTCKISWFTSPYEEEEIIKTMGEVIDHKVEESNIKDVLIISGSAGGIPAIRLANSIKQKATLLIHNPQTDLIRYRTPGAASDATQRWKQMTGWQPGMDTNTHMLDVDLFKDQKNKYYILQQAPDVHHIINHFLPLCSLLGIPSEEIAFFFSRELKNIFLQIGLWGSKSKVRQTAGHYQINGSNQIQFINDFISGKRDFDEDYFRKWDDEEE